MKQLSFLLFSIFFAITATFLVSGQTSESPDEPNPVYDPLLISPYYAPASFACNCDKTCGDITTCEEAYFQLVECGCTQRDTDNDGIPCEGLCNGVNPSPVANGESYSTPYETKLTVSAGDGVLKNDTDYNGDALSAIKVSNPANGTLLLNANGSFEYTPNVGFSGSDSFTYRASDGTNQSGTATVSITVQCTGSCGDGGGGSNTAPVANFDTYSTTFGTKLSVSVSNGVLQNDTDANNDTLTAIKVSDPDNGILLFNANGSFEYTPNSGFSGSDNFTYRASDGTNQSNITTVSISVFCTGDCNTPVAAADSYNTPYETTLSVTSSNGVLKNDTSNSNSTLSAIKVSDPSNGTLTLNSNGSFEYTPNSGFSGLDSFTYKATNGTKESNTVIVSINVQAQVIELELSSPIGFVSDVLGLTYTWQHTGASGYVVYLAPQNDLGTPRFYEWIASGQYCDDTECNVKLTDISLSAWLENNAYEVWLCGTSSGFTCAGLDDWKGPFRFTLLTQRPGVVNFLPNEEIPDLTNTGSPDSDPPTFVWQLDGSADRASWFLVWYGYVVPQQDAPTIYWPITYGWYPRTDLCEGDLCTLKTTTDKLCFDGHYEIYVQSWGPGGISTGGIDGWANLQVQTCNP